MFICLQLSLFVLFKSRRVYLKEAVEEVKQVFKKNVKSVNPKKGNHNV